MKQREKLRIAFFVYKLRKKKAQDILFKIMVEYKIDKEKYEKIVNMEDK